MNLKIFVLGPYQSNCYVLYKDFKAMIIDPGFESKELLFFLKEKGLLVEIIYITHGHIDHVGGVNFLKKNFPNAIVYAPIKDRYWYAKNPKVGLFEDVRVDIFTKEDDLIPFFDYLFKVIETPGHSYGSTSLYFNKILFSGDTLFKGTVGRTDLYLSNFNDLEHSIKHKLYRLPNKTVVYPGHGPITTIEFEKKHNYFIKGE
ncbi:MAG: MBL fold metallo-hydrolase [Acholeplasmataceae bacterium]|nr:MBL fold metallo-hydrolase [Acholeplasmataceae bacterium]